MARRRNPSHKNRSPKWSEILGICIVILLIVAGGRHLFTRLKTEKPKPPVHSVDILWEFDGANWRSSDTPPACEELLMPVSPVDTSLAVALLYPGQYRGMDYRPYGGFQFDASRSKDLTVRLPMDARLTTAAHYIEAGEVQYLLTFTNPCGIMYSFDHLYTLSSRLKAIADTLPPPKDTIQELSLKDGPKFMAGEVVATAVGSPRNNTFTMGYGVYDLRVRNEISKDVQWASLHADEAKEAYFGVCWFDLLPALDALRVKELVERSDPAATVSDYCVTPGGKTLQYNSGKPV